ncbi:MAG: CshA/CshB family fibrillar adhesin-related protein, partial [Bifidobacteriaceae bacterium]|nr:CshA/CshB family fibrillar adhesin-related protein [Bifidobacteriaceae bacterium]
MSPTPHSSSSCVQNRLYRLATQARRWLRSGVSAGLAAGLVLAYVGINSVALPDADARFADEGLGRFPDLIDWFEWGEADEVLTMPITKSTPRIIAGKSLVTTCTLTQKPATQGTEKVKAYRPGTWIGDGLDNLYNVGGMGDDNTLVSGLANVTRGAAVTFTFSCSASFGDVPAAIDGLVVADAESSSKSTDEFVQAKPDGTGATWRILDTFAACPTATEAVLASDNTLKLRPNGNECLSPAGGPTAVAFMEGATSAEITVKGGGVSAIALGVVTGMDVGDAPASYNEAGALYQPSWNGGALQVGTTNVMDAGFTLAAPEQPSPRLGATVDGDSAYTYSDGADADDLGGTDDEDANFPGLIGGFIGGQVAIEDIDCTGPGYVAGWIDWNSNGTFDSGEMSGPPATAGSPVVPGAVRCPANAGSPTDIDLGWNIPQDARDALGATVSYARLRIAASPADAELATGFTFDGEVEDHAVHIGLPAMHIEQTTTGTQDLRAGDSAAFRIVATNIGQGFPPAGATVTVFADLTGVVDDAAYGDDACSGFAGLACTFDPDTNRIAWTFVPPDPGDSTELTYSAAIKPVSTEPDGDGQVRAVAWLDNPSTLLAPACEIDAAEVWTAEGVACRAVSFDLPRLTVTKASDLTTDPRVGDPVTYTVTATNAGPGDFTPDAPAVLADNLDNVDDDAPYQGDATTAPASVGAVALDGSALTWTGPLASGESIDLTYTSTIGPNGDTALTNVAWAPADPTSLTPPSCRAPVDGKDEITGEACASVAAALARLRVSARLDGPADPIEGDVLTYTLTAENTGTAAFTSASPAVVMADLADLMAGAEYRDDIDADLGAAAIDPSSNLATWSHPLGVGDTATITLTVRVGDVQDASLGATAWAAPDDSGTTPPTCDASWQAAGQCAVASIDRGVEAPALTVSAEADTSAFHNPIQVGDPIEYTFRIENPGNVVIDSVTLSDVLGNLDAVAAVAWPDPARPGRLTPGEGVTVTATVAVTAAMIADEEARVTVEAGGTDPKGVAVTSPQETLLTPVPPFAGIGTATFEVLTTSAKPADGVAEHLVEVVLLDVAGNGVTGVADQIDVALEPVFPQVTVTETTTPGTYRAAIVSTKSGVYQVSGAWGSEATLTNAGSGDTIVFTAGTPTSATLTSDTAGQVLAPGGIGVHRATVTLLDAHSNPVPNIPVTFDVQPAVIVAADPARPGTGSSEARSSITDEDGQFTIELTSPVIASATVKATADGAPILADDGAAPAALTLDFDYVDAPCPDPAVAFYTVTPAGPVPVVTGSFTLRVRLATCAGTLMVDQEAFLAGEATGRSGGGDAAVTAFTADPAVPGEYTATITSTAAGVKDLSVAWTRPPAASGQPIAAAGADQVEFTPGPPVIAEGSAAFAVSTFVKQPVLTGAQQVYVHLEDAQGNVVADPAVAERLTGRAPGGQAAVGRFSLAADAPAGYEYAADVTSAIAGSHRIAVDYRLTPSDPVEEVPVGDGGLANADAVFVAGVASCAWITAQPDGPVTAGTGAFAVVVAVTDGVWNAADARCMGNPVPEADVLLTADAVDGPGAATLTPAGQAVTGAQGTAAFSATSVKSGAFRLVATFGSDQGARGAANSPTIVFSPGAPSAVLSRLSVDDDDPRLADGDASHAVTVTVVDTNTNPVPGRTVRFDLSAPVFATGQAPGEDATAVTGPDGRATVYIRSTTAVVASPVYAFVRHTTGGGETQLVEPGSGAPQRVLLRFVPASVDPNNSGFEVVTRHADPLPTAGVDAHRVVAILADSRGNPAAVDPDLLGGKVTIPGKADGAVGGWTQDTTDPTGATYWAPATSPNAGRGIVTVTYGGATIMPLPSGGIPADRAEFIAGSVSPSKSTFAVTDTPNVAADGEACQTVSVTLVDAFDNPVEVATGLLEGTAAPAVVGAFAGPTAPGRYEACITSTRAGSHAVQVRVSTAGGGWQSLSPATGNSGRAVFVAGEADPTRSTLRLDRTSQVVGEIITATVTVRDFYGNLVGDESVTVRLSPDTFPVLGGGPGYLTAKTALADDPDRPGEAVFTFTSQHVGDHEVNATLPDAGDEAVSDSPLSVTFTVGDPASATLTRDTPETMYVNSGLHRARIAVRDAFGNPVIGQDVAFTVSGLLAAAMVPPSGEVRTGDDGDAIVEVGASAPGTATLRATLAGSSVAANPESLALRFSTTQISAANSEYWVSTGTRVADGMTAARSAHQIWVHVRDLNGADVDGAEVAESIGVSVTGPKGAAMIGPDGFAPVAGQPGVYTALLTSTTADVMTVGVHVNGTVPPRTASPDTLAWVPGPVDLDRSEFAVDPTSVVADDVATVAVDVILRDVHGNEIPGRANDLRALAPPATDSAFDGGGDSGVYTAHLRSAVAGRFTVSVNLRGEDAGPIGHGSNNAVARFHVGPASGESTLAVTAGTKLVTSQFHTAEVMVYDIKGNAVPGAAVTFDVPGVRTWNGGGWTVLADAQGKATIDVTADSEGTYAVAATVEGADGTPIAVKNSGATIEFVHGPIDPASSHFEVSQKADVVADGAEGHHQEIEVWLASTAGVGIAGRANALTATIVSGVGAYIVDLDESQPGVQQFVAKAGAPAGTYVAYVRSTKSGPFPIAVSAAGEPLEVTAAGRDIARFKAGDASPTHSTLRITEPTAPVGGEILAEVLVRDPLDNPVPFQFVELKTTPVDAINPDRGTLPFLRVQADNEGVARFTLSTEVKGIYTVYASLLLVAGEEGVPVSNSGLLDVEFIAGEASQATTMLTGSTGPVASDREHYHWARVTAKDRFGNLLEGKTVSFALTDPDGGAPIGRLVDGYTSTAVTDENGVAEVRYVGDWELGTTIVAAKVGAMAVTNNSPTSTPAQLTWDWVSSSMSSPDSWYELSEGTKTADGVQAHRVRIVLANDEGKPVVGEAANLVLTATPVPGSPARPDDAVWTLPVHPTPVPGQPGLYEALMTSTYAATFAISVVHTVGGAIGPDPSVDPARTTVTFVPGDMDRTQSWFEVSVAPPNRLADGVDTHTLTAVVRDAAGNGVRDLSLAAEDSATPHQVAVDAFTSPQPGVYTAELRSTTAGSFAMSATATDAEGTSMDLNAGARNRLAVFVSDTACSTASTFEVFPRPAPGDGTTVVAGRGAYELRAIARDCTVGHNLVAGASVVFETDPDVEPALTAPANTVTTGSTGVASLTVTSELAGRFAASAMLDGVEDISGSPAPIVFAPAEPDRLTSTLTGTADESRIADGFAFHVATVSVRDRFSNPIEGQSVTVSVAQIGRAATVVPAGVISPDGRTVTTVTDTYGKATVHIVSDAEVGTARVTAKIGDAATAQPILASPGVPASLALAFVPDTVDPGNSYYTVSAGERIAGVESHTLTVGLRDAYGAPVALDDPARQLHGTAVPDAEVINWRVSPDPLQQATYIADIVSTKAGTKLVGVEAAGLPIPTAATGIANDASVVFVAGGASQVNYEVSQEPGIKADGTSYQTVSITVTDRFGNHRMGDASRIDLSGDNLSFTDPVWTVDHYSSRVTSRVAGSHLVSMEFDDAAVPTTLNRWAAFTAGDADAGRSTLTVSAGIVRAGDDTHRATVRVRDAEGNPVPTHDVTIWTTPDTTPAPLLATVTTDDEGWAAVDFTSQRAGMYTVFAALGASRSGPQVTDSGALQVVFAHTDIDWSTTTLTATTGHKPVNNPADPHRAEVTVRDRFGNPVNTSGTTVQFALTGLPGAALSDTGAIAVDGDGIARVTITSTAEGTARLTARVGSTSVQSPAFVDLVFRPSSVVPTASSFEVTTDARTADGVDPHTLTVHLRDSFGAGVTDAADLIDVGLTPRSGVSGHTATVSRFTAVTGAPGDYTATITSTDADTYDLEVLAGGVIAPTPTSPSSVRFAPGTVVAGNSSFAVTEGVRIANGNSTGIDYHEVTATLRDRYDNGVPGLASSLTGLATPFTVGTFSEVDPARSPGLYVAVITSTKADTRPVSVALDGAQALSAGSANAVARFVAGPIDGGTSTLVAATSGTKLVVAEQHTVRVTAVDVDENPVAGATVMMSTVPVITDPAWNGIVRTDERGIAELSFTTRVPRTYVVHASILGLDGITTTVPAGSGDVTVAFRTGPVAPASSWFTVTADASKIANGTDSQTLTVFLADAAGIGIAGLDATALVVPSTDRPGPVFGEFVEDSTVPGLYRSAMTSRVAGTFTVDVITTVRPDLPLGLQVPSGNAVTRFAPDQASPGNSHLQAAPPEQYVTRPVSATATIADANGNAVIGQTVRFWVTDTEGRTIDLRPGATYLEPRTGSGGVASIDFTTDVAGTYRVYAALIGLPGTSEPVHLPESGQVTVVFTALPDPDLDLSSLTGTDTGPRPVGGADPDGIHTAWVTLVDTSPAHNPIPGMTVEFRITGVGTAVDGTTVSTITNTEGVARLRVASDVAGVARVSARVADPATPTTWITVPARPAGASAPAEYLSLVFEPGPPDAGTSTFSVSQGTKVADGVAAHTIDIVLRDAWGNAIPGAADDLMALATPDDGVTIGTFTARGPASSPFDGRYTAPVTSTRPGTKTIAVRAGTLDIPAGTGANRDAVFTPRPPSPVTSQIVIQAPRIVLVGDGTSPGTSTLAIITLRDQDGRELGTDGAGLTVALTSTLTSMRWSDLDGVAGIVTDRGDGT